MKLLDSSTEADELVNSVISAQEVETNFKLTADFTNLKRFYEL